MRLMSIPRFKRQIEILDFDFLVRTRLNQAIVIWPEQAIPLAGYMAWPNDPKARGALTSSLRAWPEGSEVVPLGCARFKAIGRGSPTSSAYTTT